VEIDAILRLTAKPEIHTPGTARMWDDPYISKHLLNIHLSPDTNLASRKPASIRATVDWILSRIGAQKLDLLDLGCGPGLYTELMAAQGHRVTGIDCSANSIRYAKEHGLKGPHAVQYLNQDYLLADLGENKFDLILMIYTDFGVLLPDQRSALLTKIRKALKPGGIFVFDVANDREVLPKVSPPHWDCQQSGFWRPTPYLSLSNTYLYEKEKVILSQHVILGAGDDHTIYRFWTHLFSHDDLDVLLKEHGFPQQTYHEDVLPPGDTWNGDNVTFCIVKP